jgi:hypothetical protein
MRARALLLAPLALVACGTPQEQCIRRETGELRKIERLIAKTEGNLARGYAYEYRDVTRWAWVACIAPGPHTPGTRVRTQMCWEPQEDTVRDEVPIDPAAEKRKLAGLTERRAALAKAAAPAMAACKAAYPE